MPLHPAIVHLPLALTFVLPVLVIVFAWAINTGKMDKRLWFVIIGLQVLVTATGYISLETGETDEHKVEAIVGKEIIHEHEEAAEVFVGTTVISLAAGIVIWFLQGSLQQKARYALIAISLLPIFFAFKTGTLGGEIVYQHGGASAHVDAREVVHPEVQPLGPVEESDNESLKPDENDYSGENFLEDDSAKTEE